MKHYNLGTYPYASIKDVQVTKEAFSSQKRTPSTWFWTFLRLPYDVFVLEVP
jgi:hypothetical protein